jgi:glycosyltransferase involved in cell wall biosynthesis
VNKPKRPLTILRLLHEIKETSAPYNQFSLPLSDKQNITLSTYFQSTISPPKEITVFEGNGSLIGFFRVLRAALTEKEYDIIHAHTPHVGFLFLMASMMYGKFKQPTVYTVHNSYHNIKFRNRLMLIPVFTFFRRVVCCSRSSFESFPRFLKWLAGDRLCFVQNGIDIDRVDQIIENGRRHQQKGHFTVATVGRLIEIKNPLSILMAFQQSAEQASRLVFIGGGHLHEILTTEIKAAGLGKRVELLGLISREKVYTHLIEADVFISTSYGEGLPIAVLEAMACRCPVLLSDIPPHREIAGVADFIPLVDADDTDGFARELDRFRRMSSSRRAQIGAQCRKLAEAHFSLTAMHKRYEEVYLEVITRE